MLERGAVEGEVFHRGAVQALTPEETQVTPRLAALVRRELIRPERAQFAGEDGFRFRHLLIRDAAYDALPKAVRAELHERFAAWLEHRGASSSSWTRSSATTSSRPPATGTSSASRDPALAVRAGERLAAAGRSALWRGDYRPRRAARAGARADPAGAARRRCSSSTSPARCSDATARRRSPIADAAAERARAAGDETGELLARVGAGYYRSLIEADPAIDELEQLARTVLPLLEQAEDHAGLAYVWYVLGTGVANWRGRYEDWAHAAEQALHHAAPGRATQHASLFCHR